MTKLQASQRESIIHFGTLSYPLFCLISIVGASLYKNWTPRGVYHAKATFLFAFLKQGKEKSSEIIN